LAHFIKIGEMVMDGSAVLDDHHEIRPAGRQNRLQKLQRVHHAGTSLCEK
jgi:hypothetical protein